MSSFGWNLSRPAFFDKFQPQEDGKDTKGVKTQNLTFICDDVYYIWRSVTNTLVRAQCSDIWASDADGFVPYEEWSLSNSIPFNVVHLSVRKIPKEACLIWGPLGAAVVTFPLSKKSSLVATCEILGEMTYIENPRLNIIQAKWHPTTTHLIVMILNNDNFIRSYNIDEPGVVISAITAGPLNCIPFRYSSRSDLSIDFDVGPHLSKSDYWTVFLLKSSGTLSYLLMKFVATTTRTLWEEEKIIPIDGEFEDVLEQPSTISIGRNFPLLITIGGLGGSLYHAMLLPLETETNENSALNLEDSLVSGDVILFIKEVIVLEPDIQLTFVRLVPDPLCSYRYACVHQEGIHLITVNFVPHIMKLLSPSGSETLDRYKDTSATSIYIICCKDDGDKKSDFVTATFSDSVPQKFVAVTPSGETLVYDIPKFTGGELSLGTEADKNMTPHKLNPIALNALENVTSLLAKTVNQPFLSYPPDLSPEKKEGLVLDSIRTLQKEYIYKQEQALKFLSVAVGNLLDRVEDLKEPMSTLQKTQPAIRNKAEELAEKYEELNDVQMKLMKRFQAVVSKHQSALPVMSDEERKWAKKFKEHEMALPQIKDQVEALLRAARDRARTHQSIPGSPTEEGRESPRVKGSAMQLLEIKREIIQHQKMLAELSQSIQEISGNISQ